MPRILLVDDDPGIASLLVEVLSDYEVVTAVNGAQGLTLAGSCKPDLILLDMNMPGMNGLDVCRKLKADPATNGIPVIMLTGMGKVHGVDESLELGVRDYVVKPFSLQVLRYKVKALIGEKAVGKT